MPNRFSPSLALCLASVSIAYAVDPVDFNFDIKPLLSDRCYVCHGPDAENRQAELRLDQEAGAFADSQSGDVEKVIAPGDLAKSELWARIISDDPDVMMPPPDSKLKLTKLERETIGRWIREGAKWQQHWSFRPIQEVSPPDAAAPIDSFIEQPFRKHGLTFSEPASKERLLRRVRFDLTGLPPSSQEMDDFLADDSVDAYEKLVDRLLESEAYGERVASQWLDAARYSDTYGYQVDRDRFVWPWRDWVIRAFNNNLPYDQFLTQQIAGDLLPEATQDQILATTFNRLHPQKVEGGSVPEEFRIEYVADRAQTVATAFLGLTFECARCHDHKYDPILQKEYYQLTAFFDKIDEAGLYSYFTPSIPTPTLMLSDASSQNALELAQNRVVDEEAELSRIVAEKSRDFEPRPPATLDDELLVPLEHVTFDEEREAPNPSTPGVLGRAVKLSGDDAINLKQGNFSRSEPFSISCWLKVSKRWERVVVYHRSRAWTDAGSRGYELLIVDGRLQASLIHFWPGNAISIAADDLFPIEQWQHVTLTYDGSSRASGIRLWINGEHARTSIFRDNLYKHITGGGNDHISIGERFRDVGLRDGCIDDFKVFDRQLSSAEVRHLYDGKYLQDLFAREVSSLSKAERQEWLEVQLHRDEEYVHQLDALKEARKAAFELVDKAEEIMVMREMTASRTTHILKRGAYDAKGDAVGAETPGFLPPMRSESPRNRLGLAQWLTSSEHPLTARVAVNRYWQLVFGQGLVRTPEDFGSQGRLPTHPDLLDWLAKDFIDNGWDIKRLIKQLVMSRTYRQSSEASAVLLELDPENWMLARAPSYRLPAEMLRDQVLAASGLLVAKTGGPPVKPYELEVSFKPMKPDSGDGLYRRSIYTFWKRTGPAPAMMALDAAKRDVCRVSRSRTSSPLQTLVLMNSPQFVEAARLLALNLIEKYHDNDHAITNALFRSLTGRRPTQAESTILDELRQNQLSVFESNPEAVDAYLDVGERKVPEDVDKRRLATFAVIANTLMGYDESMMKR